MIDDEDQQAQAAEYALGTLDSDERARVEAQMAADPAFAELVRHWERRLGELTVMVDPIEPPEHLWPRIQAAVAQDRSADASATSATPGSPASGDDVVAPDAAGPAMTAAAQPAATGEGAAVETGTPAEPAASDTAVAPEPPVAADDPPAGAEPQAVDEPRDAPDATAPEDQSAPADTPPPASVAAPVEIEIALASLAASVAATADDRDTVPPSSGATAGPEQDQPIDREPETADHDAAPTGSAADVIDAPAAGAPPQPTRSAPATAGDAAVIAFAARERRWRAGAIGAGLIAAGLAALAVLEMRAPDLLPAALRPPVPAPRVIERVRTVKVPTPSPGRFVVVLQKDTDRPAFVLTIDVPSRTLTARRVGARLPDGNSYELWLISDRYPAPRSLGLIGAGDYTRQPTLTDYDVATIDSATYAVSLEPQGGSRTGKPTGPVLWSGKLIEAVPPVVPPPNP